MMRATLPHRLGAAQGACYAAFGMGYVRYTGSGLQLRFRHLLNYAPGPALKGS